MASSQLLPNTRVHKRDRILDHTRDRMPKVQMVQILLPALEAIVMKDQTTFATRLRVIECSPAKRLAAS